MTRPTPRGIGVSIAALTCAITGLIWSIPQLLAVAIAASVLMLLAAVLGRGGSAVRWTLSAPQRVSRNDLATVNVTLMADRVHRFGLCLTDPAGGAYPASWVSIPVATIPIPTERRGIVTLGPWRIVRTDPWSLFTRVVGEVDSLDVVVTPRIHAASLAHVPVGLTELRGTQEFGTTTFASLREYVIGDEMRHIHWRSSAKAGTLMTRQYVDVTRPRLDFVLVDDDRAYVDHNEFECAVDLTASLMSLALISGLDVGLVTTAGERARMSRGAVGAGLDLLAIVQPVTTTSEQRLLSLSRDTTIVITGHGETDWWQHIPAAAVSKPDIINIAAQS